MAKKTSVIEPPEAPEPKTIPVLIASTFQTVEASKVVIDPVCLWPGYTYEMAWANLDAIKRGRKGLIVRVVPRVDGRFAVQSFATTD